MKFGEKIRGITPERAQAILLEQGVSVSLDKAALILDFMYRMAAFELPPPDK